MKKRISVFLISILLCLACAFPVWAGTVSRLDDQAGLLDAEQQESLSSTLDEISERDQVDVVVVTVLREKQPRRMRRIILLTMDMGRGKMVTVFYSCWIWETVTGPLQHTDMR